MAAKRVLNSIQPLSGKDYSRVSYIAYRLICLVLFIFVVGGVFVKPVYADEDNPRRVKKQFMALAQHWQLVKWNGGEVACNIYTQHDGLPSYDEVIEVCGYDVYSTWISTKSCEAAVNQGDMSTCTGYMARWVGIKEHLFEDYVDLPKMILDVKVANCLPGRWCNVPPELIFTAQEPMPDHKITKLHIMFEGFDNICLAGACQISLPQTTDQGANIEYWAESDFGDESEHEILLYRNSFQNIDKNEYRIDLLGKEWEDLASSGSMVWELFPPLKSSVSEVLIQPDARRELSTSESYLYLAGNLIRTGVVDSSSCPGNGLLENGYATLCGARLSQDRMVEYQNRYDDLIFKAAIKNNVPARLLKAIIAQESQFWPRSDTPYELGLGMITENGMDVLLRWNTDYFQSVCLPVLDEDTCKEGYEKLRIDEQYLLKSILIKQIGTDEEVNLLAGTLVANINQTNQLVKNITRKSPGEVSTYEDMWKITIANYYSGSGCLGTAMNALVAEKKELLWDDVVKKLPSACIRAEEYVNRVWGTPVETPAEVPVEMPAESSGKQGGV